MAVMVPPSWVAKDVGTGRTCDSGAATRIASSAEVPRSVSAAPDTVAALWLEESGDEVQSSGSPPWQSGTVSYGGHSGEGTPQRPRAFWGYSSSDDEESRSDGKRVESQETDGFGGSMEDEELGRNDCRRATTDHLETKPTPPYQPGGSPALQEPHGDVNVSETVFKVGGDTRDETHDFDEKSTSCSAAVCDGSSVASPAPQLPGATPATGQEAPTRRSGSSGHMKVPALPKSTRNFLSQMLRRSLVCLGPREGKGHLFEATAPQRSSVDNRHPTVSKQMSVPTPPTVASLGYPHRQPSDEDDLFCDAMSECGTEASRIVRLPSSRQCPQTMAAGATEGAPTSSTRGIDVSAAGARRAGSCLDGDHLMSRTMSGFETPLTDVMNFALSNFEEKRRMFIEQQRKFTTGKGSATLPENWNRREELLALSELLVDVSRQCANEDPSLECASVLDKDGLQVWKKEFGIGRLLVRASFIVPVTPRNYCAFVSDQQKRRLWDKNIAEVRKMEHLADDSDISYVASNRVATVYPRDSVNLRVRRALDPSDLVTGPYTSCSCSVEHPDVPEQPGRVRMDVRISCYMANPIETPFGTWSRINLFSEGDPKGWIPGAVTKMLATRVVPGTVEKLLKNLMPHHGLIVEDGGSWTGWASRKLLAVGLNPAEMGCDDRQSAPHQRMWSSVPELSIGSSNCAWGAGRRDRSSNSPSSPRSPQLYSVKEEDDVAAGSSAAVHRRMAVPSDETDSAPTSEGSVMPSMTLDDSVSCEAAACEAENTSSGVRKLLPTPNSALSITAVPIAAKAGQSGVTGVDEPAYRGDFAMDQTLLHQTVWYKF